MKRPSRRTLVIGGLTAAALIALSAFALTRLPGSVSTTSAAGTHSSAPATRPGASGGSGGSGTPAAGSSGTGSSGGGSAKKGTPPASKGSTTEDERVAPPTAPALPPTAAIPFPISAPLPKTGSATGALVAGYPATVMPQAPGSSIATSSVATQATHLQVTLAAKSPQAVADLVAFYRSALAKVGMYDSPAPAFAGATSVVFSRAGASVTLTATPGAHGTSYILYGAFTLKS